MFIDNSYVSAVPGEPSGALISKIAETKKVGKKEVYKRVAKKCSTKGCDEKPSAESLSPRLTN